MTVFDAFASEAPEPVSGGRPCSALPAGERSAAQRAPSAGALRVPEELSARVPAEQRGPGLDRDAVRLLVSRGTEVSHHAFAELPRLLRAGDLLVVNTSPTLAAAVDGRMGQTRVVVHFSTGGDDGRWAVELREPDGRGTTRARAGGRSTAHARAGGLGTARTYTGGLSTARAREESRARSAARKGGDGRRAAGGPTGTEVRLPGGARLVLEEPLSGRGERLWWARVSGAEVLRLLREHGRPIRY